ncbi:MAG TPA: hypothetical protein D7I11_03820 [Candidatus Poseidoniales archaeon]|nr:MAG TPA: hypothetical protein D7I11_03820 [Candidatus Poseidoniales archaeon]HII27535.1 hypothetical protein [Poseidonia sp.]
MPGSPYLDEPPKGLWTWPRLLRAVGLPVAAVLGICAYLGVLLEALVVITATMLAVNLRTR